MRNISDNVSDGDSKNKKHLLQLKQDNRGAAMAMVLVIIMFVSILAAVLMFVSYLGYQMRLMDKRGKDTFYDAETVLDEINTGLQEVASEAMAEAYNKVMVNYAVYDSTVMRSSEFYRTYINELKERLQGTADDGRYDVKLLRSWLSDEIVGNTTGTVADGDRASRTKFGSYGAIVESNVTPEAYTLDYKESEYIKLKDLKVTYVDRSGYVSIISTDIKLGLPTVSFAQSSEIPRLEKFSMIADETLAMGNTAAGGLIDIKGNAYAGRMLIGRVDIKDEHQNQNQTDGKYPDIASTSFIPGTNVKFESALGAGVDNMSLVISRENIEVNDGNLLTNNVEFWGDNVHLLSSGVNFDGVTNLKDDLILEGKNSEAKLNGEYNGFSMITDDNSGTPSAPGVGTDGAEGTETEDNSNNPSLSSAIIINGQDSKLDLSGLESMTIAGRSYVQTKTKAGDTTEDAYKNKSNVMMAESVSVKSNQLIYLVPSEALGCVIENDGTIGDTAFGANPLTLEQYEQIVNNPDKYCLLDGNRQIAALDYKPLSNYISQETVAGQTEKMYVPEVIFKQTPNGTLVYCYLRFTDEEKANYYFIDYYNVNTEQVDKYTRLYAKEIKMADPSAMLYLNLAGNMLVYNEGQDTPATVISAPDNGNSSYYIRQRQAKTVFSSKTSAFSALSAKLVTDISKLSIVEQGRHAFENIINITKMDEMLAASASNTVTIDAGASGTLKAIFTKSDYVVNGSTPQSSLIVSQGNVDVETDFKGLIIAAGNITVKSGGAGITIEPMELKDFAQIMDAEIELGTPGSSSNKYYVIDSFRDGINYKSSTPSTSGGDATAQVALRDLIVYEQWSKR
ncbi:MAG: hypothetical protein HDR03_00550 [Lachnospiraceae bacterium]|nr:hypothetical protein [Lachnospiraceae bacterium]